MFAAAAAVAAAVAPYYMYHLMFTSPPAGFGLIVIMINHEWSCLANCLKSHNPPFKASSLIFPWPRHVHALADPRR